MECVLACEIDEPARNAYRANFGIEPHPDVRTLESSSIPDYDVLFAGFPCQPFSIIGSMAGFADARGTLFFEIARILEATTPPAFFLENVRQLKSHQGGRTLNRILEVLDSLGYDVSHRVLNALDFGLPQKRERLAIVGFRRDLDLLPFHWPSPLAHRTPLSEILEKEVDPKHFASSKIRQSRMEAHQSKIKPAIWHENKSGNVSSHPFSCALRAGASYNYLLVDGERRLTPREMLRLQGFPDEFQIVCGDAQTRKQAGNSVPVPMIREVLREMVAVGRT
jgi:DNA (cytosine-5)-methyltransferase 1